MNTVITSQRTEDGGQKTEQSAPAFDYAKAERTIIDRAEFARLIRKHRGVGFSVYATERNEIIHGCADSSFYVTLPAKKALEMLHRCDFDAFVWTCDKYGARVHTYDVAPAWLQMKRRRGFVAARILKDQERLAHPALPGDRIDEHWRQTIERDLSRDRSEVAKLDALLASRHGMPAAA